MRYQSVECLHEDCFWRELGLFPGPLTKDEVIRHAKAHRRETEHAHFETKATNNLKQRFTLR